MSPTARGLVLVTGASGFVGRALVPALAADGWQVRAAARDPSRCSLAPGIEPAAMPDLGQPANWQPLLKGVTHVVHLAGIAHTGVQLPDSAYMRVNTAAAAELARAARLTGIARMILLSSIRAQTGPSAVGVVTQDTPPRPTDAYGRSKLAAESAVAAELGEAACVLRPVLVMGPGVKGNLAALKRLAALPVPLPFAALRNRRSLLGLANLVSVIRFALIADSARGGLFVAADPETITVAELVAAMRAALGRRPGIFPVSPGLLEGALAIAGRRALASSLAGELVVDTTRLAAAGWRPVASSSQEIGRMMADNI